MKLLKLKLENFKGIRDFTLDADGKNVKVYGSNGTGKSTLMDAFTWILFGKNSKDEKDFGIKTRNPEGVEIPKLEHAVEAELEHHGKTFRLRRVYKERWRKAHGQSEATYDGNTTVYYYGPVEEELTPVSAKRYQEIISQLIPEQLFKLLTDPLYFNEKLKWTERRAILLDVVGNVTDQDVVAADPELAEVLTIADGRSIEDTRQALRASIRKTGQDRSECAPRIDECRKSMAGITDEDFRKASEAIDVLMNQRDELKEQRETLLQNNTLEGIKKDVLVFQNKVEELRQKRMKTYNDQRADLDALIQVKARAKMDLSRKLAEKNLAFDMNRQRAQVAKDKLERLSGEWKETSSDHYERVPIKTTCPTCGQELPADRIQQAKDAQAQEEAAFNRTKAESLKAINEAGVSARKEVEILNRDADSIQDDMSTIQKQVEAAQAELDGLKAQQDKLEPADPNGEELSLQKHLRKLTDQLENGLAETPDTSKLDAQISQVEKDLDEKEDIIRQHQRDLGTRFRIQELMDQEKSLAQKQTELERKLFLCDAFLRKQAELVNDRVAEKFTHVRFIMFKPNVTNDGVEACCEASYKGVPYKDLNTGFRVNAGLDVINTLIEVKKESAPIFFDNAESVVQLIPTKAQMIRLIVSESDKTLRVEKEN